MSEHLGDTTRTPAARDDSHERHRQGTRQLFVARCCLFASAYVVAAILARKLGSTDYGVYGVVISVLLWLEMVANAGVPGATARLLAAERHDAGDVERSSRAILLSISVLLLVAIWFLAPAIASLMRIPDGATVFRIAALDLPFAALYASYDGILYGRRQFGTLARALVFFACVKVGGILALMVFGITVERVLAVTVASTCALSAILAFRCRINGVFPRWNVVRDVAVLAVPLALFLIAGQVLVNLDLWSLQSLWQGGGEVVGQYVAAANLARILMVVPAAQAGVLFASVAWALSSHRSSQARRHIQEAARFALIIAVGVNVVLSWDAADVLSLLFSSPYAGGQPFLRMLLVGFGLFALLDVFATALIAAGRQWFVSLAMASIVPIVWLTNYLLIPRLGPLGAATTMVVGMAIAATVIGTVTYRRFGSVLEWPTLSRVMLAAAVVVLTSISVQVQGAFLLGKVGLLGGVYFLVLYLSGEITARDFRSPLEGATQQSA
jgi:O-antigen/teichoic acid export membrane protein